MMRPRVLLWLLILVGAAAGCLEQHDPAAQPIAKDYCYGCHVGEYDATGTGVYAAAPPHASSSCSTECAQCHTTTTWVNRLGGCAHPEAAFPLASMGTKHTNITCTACHSETISAATGATSVAGANTDCIACHPNSSQQQQFHIGVVYDAGTLVGQPYAYSTTDHRFCLACHPKGLAAGHGPTNPFPSSHHGSSCAQCHDNASGLGHANGRDVTCVGSGCHRTHNDPPSGTGVHVGNGISPSCIASGCHPDGRSHGG